MPSSSGADGRVACEDATRRGTAVRQAAREQARAAVSGSKAEAAGAPRAGSLHRVRPAANRERDVVAAIAPASKLLGELLCRPVLATFIERHQVRAGRHGRAQTCALRTAAAFGVICATVPGLGFQLPELHFEVRRKAARYPLPRRRPTPAASARSPGSGSSSAGVVRGSPVNGAFERALFARSSYSLSTLRPRT